MYSVTLGFFPLSVGFTLCPEQKEEGNFQLFSVYLVILLEERCGESLQRLCILCVFKGLVLVGALLFSQCLQLMQEDTGAGF